MRIYVVIYIMEMNTYRNFLRYVIGTIYSEPVDT